MSDRRPRIAWIVPGFQGEAGEQGIPALGLLAEDLSRYCTLRIYAVRFPERSTDYRIGEVSVRSFGHRAEPAAGAPRRRVRSARRWAAVLAAIADDHRKAPYTLIHGLWASEPGMLAVAAGRLLGLPSLVSVAGGELAAVRDIAYGGRLRLAERTQTAMALHLATGIGVGSVDARRRILYRFPWLHARILSLPLGFSPSVFASHPCTPEANRVVCVASWAPVKGHDLLLSAARILLDRGVPIELVLIGERTDSAEARSAIDAWGLGEHTRETGAITQAAVATELQRASVAVVASWHEAQCLALIEALACRVPVVSMAVGVARDLLRDGQLGAVVATRTAEGLAEALSSYLGRATGASDRPAARRATVAAYAQPVVTARFLAAYEARS